MGPHVGCRLKFHYLSVKIFDLCQLSVNLKYFLSLVGSFFPRFVGSHYLIFFSLCRQSVNPIQTLLRPHLYGLGYTRQPSLPSYRS